MTTAAHSGHLPPALLELTVRAITLDYFVIRRIIRRFAAGSGDRILDLGCGTGVLASMFPPTGYVGVDLDTEAVAYARKRRPSRRFEVGDVTSFRSPGTYDLVLVIGILHHLPDAGARALAETVGVHLAPGGTGIIVEAINPLWKWNMPGRMLRRMDHGGFIRRLEDYQMLVKDRLCVREAYTAYGGILDYGVLIVSNSVDVPGHNSN